MAASLRALLVGFLGLCSWTGLVIAQSVGNTWWTDAHATFYGGQDASGTMGGACGYGDLYTQGYGTNTAALSNALFNNGLSCGACFLLQCKDSNWCNSGSNSVVVTATNNCPQGSFGGWCDWPKLHFDLAYPAFTQLANSVGGVVPVSYMRVSCNKQGGIQFNLNGNPWYLTVLVLNVAGAGDVQNMYIKGDSTDWMQMTHSWGQVWTQSTSLVGQSLAFRVSVGDLTYWKTWDFWSAAPSSWGFGQTYEMPYNFNW